MSIYSDYACGALSYEEFRSLGNMINAQDRYEREHEHDDFFNEPEFDDLESLDEEDD